MSDYAATLRECLRLCEALRRPVKPRRRRARPQPPPQPVPPRAFGQGQCTGCRRMAYLLNSSEGPVCRDCHPDLEPGG